MNTSHVFALPLKSIAHIAANALLKLQDLEASASKILWWAGTQSLFKELTNYDNNNSDGNVLVVLINGQSFIRAEIYHNFGRTRMVIYS